MSSTPDGSPPAALTRQQRQLIETSLALEQDDAAKAGALGYLASLFVQITLPHRDIGKPDASGLYAPRDLFFPRRTGQIEVVMRGLPRYGLPSGSYPRLFLAWLCTEAVRTRSPVLHMRGSARQFCKELGYASPLSGPELHALRRQCAALLRMSVSIESHGDPSGLEWRNIQIADEGFMAWDEDCPGGRAPWPTTLRLSDQFFRMVLSQPVPIRLAAYQAFSKSPLCMDIYAWLVYRMFVLSVSGRPFVLIPWLRLYAQFGPNSEPSPLGVRQFKSRFISYLKRVLMVYPEARGYVDVDDAKNLRLRPAPLHIARLPSPS